MADSIAMVTIVDLNNSISTSQILKWVEHHSKIGRLLVFVIGNITDAHNKCIDQIDQYADIWNIKHRTSNKEILSMDKTIKMINAELAHEMTDENGVFIYVPINAFLTAGKLKGAAIISAVFLEVLEHTSPLNIDCVGPRKIMIPIESKHAKKNVLCSYLKADPQLSAALYFQSHFTGLNTFESKCITNHLLASSFDTFCV